MSDAKITVEYGRKVPLADYESVTISAMLTVPADFTPDEIEAALETGDFALNAVQGRVEAVVRQKIEIALYDREFQHLQAAMLKRYIPLEDMAEALGVLGRTMPTTSHDARECAFLVMALTADTIPLTWVWFRDGKHPHPHLPKPDVAGAGAESDAPAVEANLEIEPATLTLPVLIEATP